jgi:hypothetical protein
MLSRASFPESGATYFRLAALSMFTLRTLFYAQNAYHGPQLAGRKG